MKKNLQKVIALTEEQAAIIEKMERIYVEAQLHGICFAVNENSNLVAYNGLDIEDCDSGDEMGYEYADMDHMREVFPVWDCEELYLKRREA